MPTDSGGARLNRSAAVGGDEHDVFSRWRGVYRRNTRPGITSTVKRKARRRARKEAKLALKGIGHAD